MSETTLQEQRQIQDGNLGYKQELKRVLTFKDILIFGIVFLNPIAPFALYGVINHKTGGHMALAYLIGMIAMIFTAYSYGKMAGAFPVAGSSYTYVERVINPRIGSITGWMMFLDYVLLPLQINIVAAIYANALIPSIPNWIWVIVFSVFIAVVNYLGIQATAKVDTIVAIFSFACLITFVAFAVHAVNGGAGTGTLFYSKAIYNSSTATFSCIVSGVGTAALSFLGFDAVTTLAEESVNPSKDIGRAAIMTCLIGGALFILQAYIGALVWPDYTTYPNVDSAFIFIIGKVGGQLLVVFCSVAFIVALIAGGVAAQAGAARLLYGMGRDNVIPKKIFAHLDPKHKTPIYNIIIMSIISIVGAWILSLETASDLVCFGAFIGFMLVNLSVLIHFYIKKRERTGIKFISNLVFPMLGFAICFYIWINMSKVSKIVGFTWMAIGIIYVMVKSGSSKNELQDG
ncbi:amino acid permease [Clostridium carboxidivorans P7]|uniref:Amino acid permease-associated region n=1 Tax=Clostridium carboxidivorans P7 TaxID=536227 RepID=C6Q0J5_9CLOT|nr:APC family permease [Clostridium carboxidivorans]AKN32466.1 amino acid permease [Clostridium carboxidivorans P7]EET84965.1 amino acid permease-associated region [Clostridium carboxidivorans P7]EFG87655.1 amino acid permease [Clostridium carboxidivorans P7]